MTGNATREAIRSYFAKARSELGFVRQFPDCCCDVCGPGGAHTFHACHMAATRALKGLLLFHNHEPKETYDLKRLVTQAAAEIGGLDPCVDIVDALMRCDARSADLPRGSMPVREDLDEALRLAEELVKLVASRLPEDVLG